MRILDFRRGGPRTPAARRIVLLLLMLTLAGVAKTSRAAEPEPFKPDTVMTAKTFFLPAILRDFLASRGFELRPGNRLDAPWTVDIVKPTTQIGKGEDRQVEIARMKTAQADFEKLLRARLGHDPVIRVDVADVGQYRASKDGIGIALVPAGTNTGDSTWPKHWAVCPKRVLYGYGPVGIDPGAGSQFILTNNGLTGFMYLSPGEIKDWMLAFESGYASATVYLRVDNGLESDDCATVQLHKGDGGYAARGFATVEEAARRNPDEKSLGGTFEPYWEPGVTILGVVIHREGGPSVHLIPPVPLERRRR